MLLRDIATVRTGVVLSRNKRKEGTSYRLVTLKAFTEDGILASDFFETFTGAAALDEVFLVRRGDIVMRLRKPYVAALITSESAGVVVPSTMALIRLRDERIDPAFLAHYLNASQTQKYLARFSTRTTIPTINTSNLESLPVTIPSQAAQHAYVGLASAIRREKALHRELEKERRRLADMLMCRMTSTKEL